MRPLLRSLLPFLLLLAGCGNGTLGDIWDSFPEEAFNPPDDGGGGGGGGGGGVTLEEIAAIAAGQGVSGTVKNIALATVGSETFAFLAAGTDGCHVVDVTSPDLVTSTSYVTTIRQSVLTLPVEIAGGRVDAVAVVDNTFLVCVAVVAGATPTTNCVTVFTLPTLIAAATSSTADLSAAIVLPTTPGTDLIAVTGDSLGKGGGAAGVNGNFLVATGTALTAAKIEATGTPPTLTWTLQAAPNLGTPAFTTVTDVAVGAAGGLTAVFASGKRADGEFAVSSTTLGTPLPGVQTVIESEVQRVIDDFVSTAGNYPLDLAFDALTLYVTANNEVFVYNVSTSTTGLSLVSTVSSTGTSTIAVGAGSGAFVVGAGDTVRSGASALGQARLTGSLAFPGTFTMRGVATRSTPEGLFFLACAGTGGLRILQVPSATGP
jgi:hypothetical protein